LGQGLANSTRLHPDAVARSLEIVRGFRTILDTHELERVGCVATQALREAENRDDFIVPAEEILGCPIELIAGEREATLVSRAVFESFPKLCEGKTLTVDVGGASTEFVLSENSSVQWVRSLPIGAVKLTEAALQSDPPTVAEVGQLMEAIDAAIGELPLPSDVKVIGSAGTATTIASIALELAGYEPERIHGHTLSADSVREILESLLRQSVAERKAVIGLEERRADVIAAGIAIYSRVLTRTNADDFTIGNRGLRWGLAYEVAGQSTTTQKSAAQKSAGE
ncbi:MAG: hypothetical protein JKY56_22240, partial [Kofleriaceae bacterium]|nr:hypothetical protein [Kofleriaceae bacterium]